MFPDGARRTIATLLLTSGLLLATTPAAEAQPTNPSDRKGVTVTIYPLLVRAPIFGATIELPPLPSVPGGGGGGGEEGGQSGTTDASLNAAYMAGIVVQADRWFAEFNGVYAALSATRDLPLIDIDSKTYFYNARGGVRLFDGISATAGFRRVTIDLEATLDLVDRDRRIQGRVKPGFWDPLVGVDWRRSFGKWSFDGNVEGGGFGVGTDTDLGAEVNAKRLFGNHVELRVGYEVVYLKFTVLDARIGSFERKLVSEQTLHGPQFGIGIVF